MRGSERDFGTNIQNPASDFEALLCSVELWYVGKCHFFVSKLFLFHEVNGIKALKLLGRSSCQSDFSVPPFSLSVFLSVSYKHFRLLSARRLHQSLL